MSELDIWWINMSQKMTKLSAAMQNVIQFFGINGRTTSLNSLFLLYQKGKKLSWLLRFSLITDKYKCHKMKQKTICCGAKRRCAIGHICLSLFQTTNFVLDSYMCNRNMLPILLFANISIQKTFIKFIIIFLCYVFYEEERTHLYLSLKFDKCIC